MIPYPHRVTGVPATHFDDEALPPPRPRLTVPLYRTLPAVAVAGV
jgi:hypothetical protein